MPRFNFKLEGVLRQRKQIEQQCQRELAVLQQQVRDLEQELRGIGLAMQSTTQQIRRDHMVGRLDMYFLAAHRRYSAAMQVKGQGIVQRLAALAPRVEVKRIAVAEAAKRRKAIEKLKERRREQWLADVSRKEMADMDEVSNQMFFALGVEESRLGEGVP